MHIYSTTETGTADFKQLRLRVEAAAGGSLPQFPDKPSPTPLHSLLPEADQMTHLPTPTRNH